MSAELQHSEGLQRYITACTERINVVYSIFVNYFGEDKVDIQGDYINKITQKYNKGTVILQDKIVNIKDAFPTCKKDSGEYDFMILQSGDYFATIIIWFPELTVTNEKDESINIKDLYVRTRVDIRGRIQVEYSGFEMVRSSISDVQWLSHYSHSHLPRINPLNKWEKPCLGSGPIKNTIDTLKFDYSEEMWMLFCRELFLYVQTESLQGIPYIKLTSVGNTPKLPLQIKNETNTSPGTYLISGDSLGGVNNPYCESTTAKVFHDFLDYYIKHLDIKFSYINEQFVISESITNIILKVSKAFSSWVQTNEMPVDKTLIFDKCFISVIERNGLLYKIMNGVLTTGVVINRLLTFKNQQIPLIIYETANRETHQHKKIILKHDLFCYFTTYILKIINYSYGQQFNGTTKDSSRIKKTTYFI